MTLFFKRSRLAFKMVRLAHLPPWGVWRTVCSAIPNTSNEFEVAIFRRQSFTPELQEKAIEALMSGLDVDHTFARVCLGFLNGKTIREVLSGEYGSARAVADQLRQGIRPSELRFVPPF